MKIGRLKSLVLLQSFLLSKTGAFGHALSTRFLALFAMRVLPVTCTERLSLPTIELEPAQSSVSSPPRVTGIPSQAISTTFPPIRARRFVDCVVHTDSSAFVVDGRIVLPDVWVERANRVSAVAGQLRLHDRNAGVVKFGPTLYVPEGIAVFGAGSSNWYHWLIEILPAAYLAQKLPPEYASLPFLVPTECLEHESFRASMEVFLAGRPIVTLSRGLQYEVGHLIVIDSPVNGPFNMRPGCWPTVDDYRQNNRVLERYRDRIIEHLTLPPATSGRRLFLARGNRRRQYNQQEIETVAHAHGFETVYPESLSFREQVKLFRDATCMVGGTGAAWAGLLFCRPSVRALMWSVPEYRGFCAYSNLAQLAGVDLRYIFVDSDSVLKTTKDAYNASYRVDPAKVAAELDRMVNDEEWIG